MIKIHPFPHLPPILVDTLRLRKRDRQPLKRACEKYREISKRFPKISKRPRTKAAIADPSYKLSANMKCTEGKTWRGSPSLILEGGLD